MRSWIQFDPAIDFGSHKQTQAGIQQTEGESYYAEGPLPKRQTDGDSYYIISDVKDSQEHSFTVLFHFFIVYREALERKGYKEVLAPLGLNQGLAQVAVSVLDEADATKDGYIAQAHQLIPGQIGAAGETTANSRELHIKTDLGNLEGTIDSMRLQARIPKDDRASAGKPDEEEWKIDLTMKDKDDELPLPYLATGIIPFAEDIDYEYALPSMVTSGTLRRGDNVYTVSGTSWFDREWGYFGGCKWTWMAIQLCNGVRLALWDQQEKEHLNTFAAGESAFATILEPHGSISVASVEVEEEERFKSPRSNQYYPSHWSVTIPAKQIELHVQLRRNDQEIIPSEEIKLGRIQTPRLEGKASVQGTCEGQKVEGNAFVELFNLFPAFANLDKAKLRGMPARMATSD